MAQQLNGLVEMSKGSGSSKEVALSPFSEMETMTSLSTVLEQDFTVEGRKGSLECPFSKKKEGDGKGGNQGPQPNGHAINGDGAPDDTTPHHSADPICAAMYEESMSAPARSTSATKCPIRFLDRHSPEEIANYVEKHKHEIPRSHEVCVRRYQRSQDQIRKLDAKYGNLSNMIQGLSQLHKPMLPVSMPGEGDQASNERVETWANGVSASDEIADPARSEEPPLSTSSGALERESHFDRPLKEVRVGESPSRPWGISVPVHPMPTLSDHPRRASSPAAPVRIPSPSQPATPQPGGAAAPRKCPFDHTKLAFASPFRKPGEPSGSAAGDPLPGRDPRTERPFTPVKNRDPPTTMPTFVNPPPPPSEPKDDPKDDKPSTNPQMVFNITGPVFIGYPMDQAMHFMQNFQGGR